MPLRLLLIRHGQTDWNVTGRWQGQADPPLNELGRDQARHAARAIALQVQGVDVLISSDLRRARETAEIIARAIGCAVVLEPRLREVNLGDWQGLLSEEIRARWPEQMRQWHEAPLATRPPNGESIEELAGRVLAAVRGITARYAGGCAGIVAHELPIAVIATHAAGIPLDRLRDHIPPNAAWQTIE